MPAEVPNLPDFSPISRVAALRPPGSIPDRKRHISLADRSNLNLAIADRDVEIQRRQKDLARSPMLPQIFAVSDLTAQRLGGLENILRMDKRSG